MRLGASTTPTYDQKRAAASVKRGYERDQGQPTRCGAIPHTRCCKTRRGHSSTHASVLQPTHKHECVTPVREAVPRATTPTGAQGGSVPAAAEQKATKTDIVALPHPDSLRR